MIQVASSSSAAQDGRNVPPELSQIEFRAIRQRVEDL